MPSNLIGSEVGGVNTAILNLFGLHRRTRATGLSTVAYIAWTSPNRQFGLPKEFDLPTSNISILEEALNPKSDVKILELGQEYDSAILPQQ